MYELESEIISRALASKRAPGVLAEPGRLALDARRFSISELIHQIPPRVIRVSDPLRRASSN